MSRIRQKRLAYYRDLYAKAPLSKEEQARRTQAGLVAKEERLAKEREVNSALRTIKRQLKEKEKQSRRVVKAPPPFTRDDVFKPSPPSPRKSKTRHAAAPVDEPIPAVVLTPATAATSHRPDLPGHTIDALGRYRPDISRKEGTFSPEVERAEVTAKRIKRDGTFRDRVLGTYGTDCVICGYSLHVEAAHLDPKHQVSDDRTENGAPLCRNHHWELDNGHLTPDEVRRQRDAK